MVYVDYSNNVVVFQNKYYIARFKGVNLSTFTIQTNHKSTIIDRLFEIVNNTSGLYPNCNDVVVTIYLKNRDDSPFETWSFENGELNLVEN